MKETVQIIDSGLRSGLANHAIDRAWLAAHAARERGPVLRFYRSLPTASIGRHQAADRELRLEYCRSHGIEVARRMSGGGALYLDPGQLAFSLVVRRPPAWRGLGVQNLLHRLCLAMARALHKLGIEAEFKGPNDLEVEGRKIASAFCAASGKSLLLHGTLLLEADVKTMLEALRAPTEKLSQDGLAAARERIITVAECLGVAPDMARVRSALQTGLKSALGLGLRGSPPAPAAFQTTPLALDAERALAGIIDWSGAPGSAIEALWRTPGTTLRARAEIVGECFTRVRLAGDLHLDPPGLLTALEENFKGLAVDLGPLAAERFFERHGGDLTGIASRDFVGLMRIVVDKHRLQGCMNLTAEEASAVMPWSADNLGAAEIVERAGVVLVPYCAKPVWCEWRHLDGCPECGLCQVGEAYRMAREKSMAVHTITNYEQLVNTLAAMKAEGVAAYLGMCCSHFFIKRHRAFREAGLPVVLMDISGANCYELGQEAAAYAGRFDAQSEINAELLCKVMKFVPRPENRAERIAS